MNALVSIIIPAYNYGFVLAETIENLFQQSYPYWEAIIVDDGSSDNTREVVEGFAGTDNRIQYVFQKNSGVSAARNHGIRISKGKYIQFLDADDLLSPEKLSIQVAFMETHPETDLSYTNHLYFENDDPQKTYPDYERNNYDWLPRINLQGYDLIRQLMYSNIAVVSSPMLKRGLALKTGGFPEDSHHTEDWEFWFLCTLQQARFTYIDSEHARTFIRIHGQSVSQGIEIMQAGELRFRDRMEQHLQQAGLSAGEMEQLLQQNLKSRDKLFKYMMYHADLTNFDYLKKLVKITGKKRFFNYLLKSINYKRKQLFKGSNRKYTGNAG